MHNEYYGGDEVQRQGLQRRTSEITKQIADIGKPADPKALPPGWAETAQGGQTYYVNSFAAYPGYRGPLDVTGSATIDTSSRSGVSAQAMTWDLSGADTSGGIHIHDGTSCESCSATTPNCGHYFDSATVSVDPWGASTYTSDADGHAAADGPTILTGLDAAVIEGKIVVVHNSNGTRIACGLISSTPAGPLWIQTPSSGVMKAPMPRAPPRHVAGEASAACRSCVSTRGGSRRGSTRSTQRAQSSPVA